MIIIHYYLSLLCVIMNIYSYTARIYPVTPITIHPKFNTVMPRSEDI